MPMRKSINIMVGIRVIFAFISVLLFSIMVTKNISLIEKNETSNEQVNALLSKAQQAETAHYKWSTNLSNALYANTEFTGSIDPTSCILGQWIYGDTGIEDEFILNLHKEMEPLHKELHESATYVLNLMKTDPAQAQEYYQKTILSNLTTLVGLLDDVVEHGTELSEASSVKMKETIRVMRNTAIGGFILALVCLISLIVYVFRQIVRPILMITKKTSSLQDGKLDLQLNYHAKNELGDLSTTLENSVQQIRGYVQDINHIMKELSDGNFNVYTSVPFIGDFQSIQESVNSFTSTMSTAIDYINQAEDKVSGNAGNLSGSAQQIAEGATQQASAVEELFATLDDLSGSAAENVKIASGAQKNARLTGEQVTVSSQQMEQMVAAMNDIKTSSDKIEKIIAAIENIAFQTNILALNAAVEATHAGEAGKGFAVVASEVRSLANQSDQAVQATKELIENSVRAAEKGNQIVGEVSQTLKTTLDLITQSNSDIGIIAEAVQTEAASIQQITEAVGQISNVVQTNSASSEEAAAVSAELFEQVRLLQNQTQRFKLKQRK